MTETAQVIEITPIREIVSGYTIKVQVKLDEDASDQEILRSLGEVCKEWGANIATGSKLMLLVGRHLLAIEARGIHKQDPWGSMDRFIQMEITDRHGIGHTMAWNAKSTVGTLAEYAPRLTMADARAIKPGNLLLLARAVKNAPEGERKGLATKLIKVARTTPHQELRAQLESQGALRTKRRRTRLIHLSFDVTHEDAAIWRNLIDGRSSTLVFHDLVESYQMRKGPKKSDVLRRMREERAVAS